MAKQTVCDNCGKTDSWGADWIKLTRPHPDTNPGAGVIYGRQELDFHNEACVVSFLQSEILQGRVSS